MGPVVVEGWCWSVFAWVCVAPAASRSCIHWPAWNAVMRACHAFMCLPVLLLQMFGFTCYVHLAVDLVYSVSFHHFPLIYLPVWLVACGSPDVFLFAGFPSFDTSRLPVLLTCFHSYVSQPVCLVASRSPDVFFLYILLSPSLP